jgi:hypothetical protein
VHFPLDERAMSSCFTTGSAAPEQHARRSVVVRGLPDRTHNRERTTEDMLSKISAALLFAALAGTPALAAPVDSHPAAHARHHAKASVTKVTKVTSTRHVKHARHIKHMRHALHVKHQRHLHRVAAVHGGTHYAGHAATRVSSAKHFKHARHALHAKHKRHQHHVAQAAGKPTARPGKI